MLLLLPEEEKAFRIDGVDELEACVLGVLEKCRAERDGRAARVR